MAIQESGEMYLETIYILSQVLPEVHASEVARKLGYSKASASRGLSILKEKGMIEDDNSSALRLTKKGKELAAKIYERHTTLTKYFIQIGVDDEIAEMDACRIEHIISDETFEAIKGLIK
jgi:DtxR family transcriptional regulator, Mn-dependent transcriptional regulator